MSQAWSLQQYGVTDVQSGLDLIVSQVQQPHWQLLLLALATLISEDLTCIAAGMLAASGEMSLAVAISGCAIGIYVGDLGLWLLGRCAGGWVERRWGAHWRQGNVIERMGAWFDEKGWIAIVASRFMPGTRLPLYVSIGMLGRKGGRFALWTAFAVAIWTPGLVLLAWWWGET